MEMRSGTERDCGFVNAQGRGQSIRERMTNWLYEDENESGVIELSPAGRAKSNGLIPRGLLCE